MPEKYHIKTKPVPPRRPRIGKYGVVDWREDCARCHNCVKKACVYDRYRQEAEYIRHTRKRRCPVLRLHGLLLLRPGLHEGPAAPRPSIPNTKGSGQQLLDARHHSNDLGPGRDGEDSRLRGRVPRAIQRDGLRFACGPTCPRSFGRRATAFTAASTSAPRWTSGKSPRILASSGDEVISRRSLRSCPSRCR